MSDFGAGTFDFHSDFVSDFRKEGNDYASDFRTESSDFASDFHDFPGDFGGGPRTEKQPPEATETAPPDQVTATDEATGNMDGGKLAAHRTSSNPRSSGKRHAARP